MTGAFFAALTLVVLAGCGGAPGETPPGAGDDPTPVRVDSVLPPAEAMRRFAAGLERPERLAGGAASLEELARAHLRAAQRGDTAALRRMHLTRAEFAYLYYPDSPLSRPPYELPPGLTWLRIERGSERGMGLAFQELRGREARFDGVRCGRVQTQGAGTLHTGCVVRYAGGGEGVREGVLFGPVLERGGHFKFVSYAGAE